MQFWPRCYVFSIVAAAAAVLAAALANWSSPQPLAWVLYLAVAAGASAVKLRLPGLRGTYSLNFAPLLFGVTHLSFPETVLAASFAGFAQSVSNSRQRPASTQTVFNMANLVLSVAAGFLAVRFAGPNGLNLGSAAVLAVVACVFFVVNTSLVSGALALFEGAGFRHACGRWYEWPLPYFLVGSALVAVIPAPGHQFRVETWIVVMPLVYLVHFFVGLPNWRAGKQAETTGGLPASARAYALTVSGAGMVLAAVSVFTCAPGSAAQFAAYVLLAAVTSALKVRLPRMAGTISLNFILLLVGVAEVSLPEVVILSVVAGVTQSLWRAKVPPMPLQLVFNAACLSLSSTAAFAVARWGLEPLLGRTLIPVLCAATLVLYGCNTLMVSTVLCLIEGRLLCQVWQLCYFWSFPYYLVGSVATGLILDVSRSTGWLPSLLILPVMALIYVSYRMHVSQAVARQNCGAPVPAAG